MAQDGVAVRAIESLPPPVEGPAVWYGPDMAKRTRMGACPVGRRPRPRSSGPCGRSPSAQADIARITKADFPLPTLAPKLARICDEVLDGRGFALMRGLPVERWSIREAATAYFGIGTHLGSARSQNAQGHVLGHVHDLGLDVANDPNVRIYQTRERQTYHTDSCDIVGLLCLKTAKSGGLSALVSSMTIYNEMRSAGPTCCAACSSRCPPTGAARCRKARSPISRSRSSTGTRDASRRSTSASTSTSARRFPEAPRLTPSRPRRSTCSTRWPTTPPSTCT